MCKSRKVEGRRLSTISQNLIEKLKSSFSTQQTDKGVCLVIPGTQWEPDWEAELPKNYTVFYEKGTVLIKLPKSISSKIDENSSSKIDETPGQPTRKRGRKPNADITRRTKNWGKDEEKLLKAQMERRDLVALPMPMRAAKLKTEQPDLFPTRSAIALVQHYKQCTTPVERAAALAESLKPQAEKVRWENTQSRQEKYILEKDGLKLMGLAVFEKGVLQRISAVVTPQTAGNTEAKAVLVNELPVDVLKLLYCLVEQLQQEPQQ
jgi:hypothetical protein